MAVSENKGYCILGSFLIRILLCRVLYWGPLFSETPIYGNVGSLYRILYGNPKKELLWSLWVETLRCLGMSGFRALFGLRPLGFVSSGLRLKGLSLGVLFYGLPVTSQWGRLGFWGRFAGRRCC